MRTTDMADELVRGPETELPAGVRLATAKQGGVTVTPPRLAVATRTPVGGALPGARNSSSARSVSRMFIPLSHLKCAFWAVLARFYSFSMGF